LLTLDQVRVGLKESFNATAEQKCVFVAFLSEQLRLLHTLSFIEHVANDELVWCVLKPVQLRDRLVPRYVRRRKIDGLFDVPLGVLFGFSQVEE